MTTKGSLLSKPQRVVAKPTGSASHGALTPKSVNQVVKTKPSVEKKAVVSKQKSPAERIKADRATVAVSPAGIVATPSASSTSTIAKNVEVATKGLEEVTRCPLRRRTIRPFFSRSCELQKGQR